jgi:4-alpha-glucanotransferase
MDTHRPTGRRESGLLIPLFSARSATNWGIGEIADLPGMTAWLSGAGQRVLQLLPLNEMATGEYSPYSAMSAMAIDPIYVAVPDVHEFAALGGEAALGVDERRTLERVRSAPRIAYREIRALKRHALERAFARFLEVEWRQSTPRARQMREFLAEQAWWIDEYSLFRALHGCHGERPWTTWPEALRQRDRAALDRARQELSREVLFYQYLQWVAHVQWSRARGALDGVAVYGDLPFMVDGDSADVWARQDEFRLDESLGAPPDAFSATGQDWGMPVYNWEAIARHDFRWLRDRARRSAELYDGYRIDHLVGFYRTYGKSRVTGEASFTPAEPHEQTALGERVLEIFRDAGAAIIAEDLGTVPEFVRESLARVGVPGLRVLRWERHWHDEGRPFRDTVEYPSVSVATSGTHDTEPLMTWWEQADGDVHGGLNALPTVQHLTAGRGVLDGDIDRVRDVLLEALFASSSNLLILPVQDVFGWRDRINTPGTVGDWNWTFRLPWSFDEAGGIPEVRERQDVLRAWTSRYRS